MTEKDAVKYTPDEHPAIWYLPVSVSMSSTDEETVLADLTARIDRYTREQGA